MLLSTAVSALLALSSQILAVSAVQSAHTSNWAVLVSTSRFWFNYRHLANVLSLYRTVKRLGIPDSQILLLLPDDMACNPRNIFPGTVYNNADRALDLYGENIEVDYRGYEVTVENFIRLLTDRFDENVPRGKRLGSDAGSNVLVYMTGHGGKEFLKFQDAEEISSHDLADAFAQMWEKKRYRELLFMIDTCQANTMFEHFYSPNIIATGSSALDQSSYSHHADNDVGVAVIDRWTYYILDFLETQVKAPDSKLTLGHLFDSYDSSKIHSDPGLRWDLFNGGEQAGRERLVMDFFGNVQGVQLAKHDERADAQWEESMRKLEVRFKAREEAGIVDNATSVLESIAEVVATQESKSSASLSAQRKASVGKISVDGTGGWSQQAIGATALAGCALVWGLVSVFN